MSADDGVIELSIVMPCLDEARTVGVCVAKAKLGLERCGAKGEVIVADNGSVDGSQEIARREGARVVAVEQRGYGAALRAGIEAAAGRYVLLGDSDDSYDFSDVGPFLARLRAGDDLVMGNRFRGGIRPGAMRPLHRYLGNPVLSALGRVFYRAPVGDFHCGMRAARRDAILRMNLRTTGMEFASEMIVKAALAKLKIAEVPIVLYPDGRDRPSHLRSWRDGWRHLRFLLLYSPRWLFLYPGIALMILGVGGLCVLAPGPVTVGSVTLDVHTMLYASAAILLGFQSISFSWFAKLFATRFGLLPEENPRVDASSRVPFELGLVSGAVLVFVGIAGSIAALFIWRGSSFGDLEPREVLRLVIPSILSLALGGQLILSSFLFGLFGLVRK